MTTQNIEDYLTKQLFISRNIVTYRSLSREFSIHVNVAKNELAAFHTKAAKSPNQVCCATYMVSGRISNGSVNGKNQESQSSSDMDVDMGYGFTPTPTQNHGFANGSNQYEGDVVVQVRMTVVGEDKLEDTKAKYEEVTSVHVYSLSPSPIRDADLLCAPTRQIREMDNLKGIEMAKAVGRIIGADIKMLEGGTKANSKMAATINAKPSFSKLRAGPSVSTAAVPKNEDKAKAPVKEEVKKPKPTGKLNFFAPKAPKEKEERKEKSSKDSAETKGKMFFGAASKSSVSTAKPKEASPAPVLPLPKESEGAAQTKRGTKRKSTAASIPDEKDEETKSDSAAPSGPPSRFSSKPPSIRSSPEPTKFSSKSRLHKAIRSSDDSDDEDDSEPPMKKTQRRLRRKAVPESDDDSGQDSKASKEAREVLKSVMELNDDEVEKVTRKAKVGELEKKIETDLEEEVPEYVKKDEDVEMSDDRGAKPKPKPRKKKEKKVIPIGRNGLKKRRVNKTRKIKKDDGGWSVSDRSSFESVDEEEEMSEPAPMKNGKRNIAKPVKEKKEVVEKAKPDTVDAFASGGDSVSKSTTMASTNKPAARAKGGQKQKTLNTFFGPQRAK